jgi:hypothetical protein
MGLTMILVDYPLLGTTKCKQKWVPPPFESLISSFGAQYCLPNRIYSPYAAAQSPTQTFILNHGKHPRSYEKVSSRHLPRDTFRISNFIFKISSVRYQGAPFKEITIKLLNPPRTSEIFMLASQKPRCWYTPIFILRSKYDTPPTPWHFKKT